jgi:hypothetical protein
MRLNLNTKINDLIASTPSCTTTWSATRRSSEAQEPHRPGDHRRIATITMAARLAKLEPQKLLDDVAAENERSTGQAPQRGEPEPATPEQAAQRREAQAPSSASCTRARRPPTQGALRPAAAGRRPAEIGKLENELIASGVPVAEVRRLCERTWTSSARAQQQPAVSTPAVHPVHTFMAENRARAHRPRAERGAARRRLRPGEPAQAPRRAGRAARAAGRRPRRHYVRKENWSSRSSRRRASRARRR